MDRDLISRMTVRAVAAVLLAIIFFAFPLVNDPIRNSASCSRWQDRVITESMSYRGFLGDSREAAAKLFANGRPDDCPVPHEDPPR